MVPNAGHLITIRDVDVSQVFANASRHTAEGIVRTHSLERRSGKKHRISKTERIESMSFRVLLRLITWFVDEYESDSPNRFTCGVLS